MATRSLFAFAALASLTAGAASAETWSRSFVVEWYEPAMYYGAEAGGSESPGTDCPEGINQTPDWREALVTPYRTLEEVEQIISPESDRREFYRTLGYRGPDPEKNVYYYPGSAPDPGLITVSGDIAYGFDLDDDASTGGFRTPDGETGIDNAFYRASGCTNYYRGKPHTSYISTYVHEGMLNGRFAMLIVLSGEGDPMNDPAAKMAFYHSRDPVVRVGADQVAEGYTFKVEPDPGTQSVIDVRIENGVIETLAPVPALNVRHFDYRRRPMELFDARVRFAYTEEGGLQGQIGAYQNWRFIYETDAEAGEAIREDIGGGAGGFFEELGRTNKVGWWYALRRHADAMPDPETGENTAISIAYSIDAVPAYVATPDGDSQVIVAELIPE